jgi:predicted transcriptional regulator
MMPSISVHVDEETFRQVAELAEHSDRSKSWVVADALKPYLEHRQWMIEETKKAMAEVRAGAELIPHDEVMAELDAYAGDAGTRSGAQALRPHRGR